MHSLKWTMCDWRWHDLKINQEACEYQSWNRDRVQVRFNSHGDWTSAVGIDENKITYSLCDPLNRKLLCAWVTIRCLGSNIALKLSPNLEPLELLSWVRPVWSYTSWVGASWSLCSTFTLYDHDLTRSPLVFPYCVLHYREKKFPFVQQSKVAEISLISHF